MWWTRASRWPNRSSRKPGGLAQRLAQGERAGADQVERAGPRSDGDAQARVGGRVPLVGGAGALLAEQQGVAGREGEGEGRRCGAGGEQEQPAVPPLRRGQERGPA